MKKRTRTRTPSWLQYPEWWTMKSVLNDMWDDANFWDIRDRLTDLTDEQLNDPALEAVVKADLTGNTGPLINFMRSKKILSSSGPRCFASPRLASTTISFHWVDTRYSLPRSFHESALLLELSCLYERCLRQRR